ncbi:sensor histidine kinase [Miniphocaeibacter massiliensis]|uniref:sensor histidine kinase n=1 Tax=Miniphocaeibacter massiliensis TaxID=2041841 RepID=UPI000C0886CC|nr:HAMP domain-containing sensor histidine kinase [Miniphocaeibacter massiliensis]
MKKTKSIKREILKIYCISILFPILISILFTIIMYHNMWNSLFTKNYSKYFNYITKNISDYYKKNGDFEGICEKLPELVHFDINITVYDNNNNNLSNCNLINSSDENLKDIEYLFINEKYPIIVDKQTVGYVKYEFLPGLIEDFGYTETRYKLVLGTNIVTTISLATGLILLIILIKSITKPILMLSDSTEKIFTKSYDNLNLPTTKIYELNKLSNNINYLNKNLKMQNQIRKTYSQDINHELRTPLTNLQLTLEAMVDGVIDLNDENIKNSLSEINRLKILVDNLKDTFNDEFENLKLNNTTFNLKDEIRIITESFLSQAISKNVSIIINTPFDNFVTLDKDKLTQIINNLLSNSLKATLPGDTIIIGFKSVNGHTELYVQDNGIGISKENLPLIFDRFFRVDNVRNTKQNGYGLGLAIVKNLIEIMNLEIKVDSILNQYTKFTIIIP